MPTVPPERTPFGGRESHQAREIAESFGSDPDRYDRARPRYPGALIDRIAARTPGGTREGRPGPYVLDVGCGTGIVARQFLAAGCRVLGVDPDERMAGLARRYGLEVEVATFETWPSAGREFDAVVAGQSWHWVDPAAGAAQAAPRWTRPAAALPCATSPWPSPRPEPPLPDHPPLRQPSPTLTAEPPYDMDAAFMLLLRHERGIHAVRTAAQKCWIFSTAITGTVKTKGCRNFPRSRPPAA